MIPQTVSRRPAAALQRAMVAMMKADISLKALLGGVEAVYDQAKEGTPQPYVDVGDNLSTSANDLTSFGRETSQTLHIWTRARSMKPGDDIAARVVAIFDHQHRAVTAKLAELGEPHKVVSIRSEFDQALTDPDPELRHHVVRFRVETEQLT